MWFRASAFACGMVSIILLGSFSGPACREASEDVSVLCESAERIPTGEASRCSQGQAVNAVGTTTHTPNDTNGAQVTPPSGQICAWLDQSHTFLRPPAAGDCVRAHSAWQICNGSTLEPADIAACTGEIYDCVLNTAGYVAQTMKAGECVPASREEKHGFRCNNTGSIALVESCEPGAVEIPNAYFGRAGTRGDTQIDPCDVVAATGNCYIACNTTMNGLGGTGLETYHDPEAGIDLNGVTPGTCFRYEGKDLLGQSAAVYTHCAKGYWQHPSQFEVQRGTVCAGGFIDLYGGDTMRDTPCRPGDRCWPR